MGQLLTDWLPWISTRAGGQRARTWWPPRVGEQCLVLSPGGELAQGRVLCGIYSDAFAPGSSNLKACRVDLSPTEHFEHDGDGNATLKIAKTLTLSAGQEITLQVGRATVTLTSSAVTLAAGGGRAVLDASGLLATPDSFAGEISLKNHTHDKVTAGKANTGKPQP
jgi:phage baseplate assembly protein V